MRYTINDYINELDESNQIVSINNVSNGAKVIYNLAYDSKSATMETLFVCKGRSFKSEYLLDAIKKGTIIYVSEQEYVSDFPSIIVKDVSKSLSILSKLFFNNVSNKLNVIGITGTKGKSTTAYFVKSILDTHAFYKNERDNAIISSIDTYDGISKFESHITTPESYDIYQYMQNAVSSGSKNMVMEVSSQALKYNRVYKMFFNYGVFLNIGEDHISPIEHSSFEDYFESKLKLFSSVNKMIVNMDSAFYGRIEKEFKKAGSVITFSKCNPSADILAYNIHKDGANTVFNVRTKEFDREFVLSMPGVFNVENALAAIGIAVSMGVSLDVIFEGLYKAKASGRMELFVSKDEKISVLVDYAHNKLSFEKLYESVKNEYPFHRIVTVFGCPGGKALSRRKDLGLISGINSDEVILCSEDPGRENTKDISEEIASYVRKHNSNCLLIEDRFEALKYAVEESALLERDTIILITGKGRETRQKIGESYIQCSSDVENALILIEEYDKTFGNKYVKKIKK